MSNKRGFASDNNSGVHPAVLEKLKEVNTGHEVGYGDDPYTALANKEILKIFGSSAEVFFTFGGTGANVVSLQAAANSFEGVICAHTAHINKDECGAPEKFTGSKLLPISTKIGKISPEDIKPFLFSIGFEHHVQPKVISLTQATELGTVYQPDEIREISAFARENSMIVQMDGARLANAAAFLNMPLAEFTTEAGIDILSFGGTKNGLLFGEAIVVLNPLLVHNLKYIRKQSMQLFSKMRYISAQFLAVLEDDLWLTMARHSNRMAQSLAAEVAKVDALQIVYPVEANAVFVKVPKHIIAPLQKEFFFYVWNEQENIVRWMTSFDTTENDIEAFSKLIRTLLKK